jgi:hypothetical protein
MRYYLKVYGREIEMSSHVLSDEQVESVRKMMITEGYKRYTDCQERIEEVLNWNKFKSNMFYITKPELYDMKLELYEHNILIDSFTSKEVSIKDRRNERIYYTVPQDDWHHNILVSVEENKGPLYILEFNSDIRPNRQDFIFEVVPFETHTDIYDIVDSIFYKNIKLQITEFLDKKSYSTSLKIWTLDDIYRDLTTN